jgi:hypothetical protein
MLFALFIVFFIFLSVFLSRANISFESARYLESIFCLPPTQLEMAVEDSEKKECDSGEDGDTEDSRSEAAEAEAEKEEKEEEEKKDSNLQKDDTNVEEL